MSDAAPLAVGVIGCGMVSHAYLGTIARAPELTLRALASRTTRSAETQAARYGGTAVSVDALLADPAIDLVVVLAPPDVHHALGRRVLEAGKHLYLEKPLATTLQDAADLLTLAEAQGRAIGCAPDTFLGVGHRTARCVVDDGGIGRIVGGAVAFGSPGMESWHPNPASFYAAGGGPLLDVGPYYVTQLVNLLGSITAVTAIATMPRTTRIVIAPGGTAGDIPVAVPTTVNGALLFESGVSVSIALSWDVAAHTRPLFEIYGEDGTMDAPDPNRFDGVTRTTRDGRLWMTLGDGQPSSQPDAALLARAVAALADGIDPTTDGRIDAETALRFGDRRGLGVLDLADAIAKGRPPRASGALAYHVLEVLIGLESSSSEGRRADVVSRVDRPLVVAA